jgi:hypothetical protein
MGSGEDIASIDADPPRNKDAPGASPIRPTSSNTSGQIP